MPDYAGNPNFTSEIVNSVSKDWVLLLFAPLAISA